MTGMLPGWTDWGRGYRDCRFSCSIFSWQLSSPHTAGTSIHVEKGLRCFHCPRCSLWIFRWVLVCTRAALCLCVCVVLLDYFSCCWKTRRCKARWCAVVCRPGRSHLQDSVRLQCCGPIRFITSTFFLSGSNPSTAHELTSSKSTPAPRRTGSRPASTQWPCPTSTTAQGTSTGSSAWTGQR